MSLGPWMVVAGPGMSGDATSEKTLSALSNVHTVPILTKILQIVDHDMEIVNWSKFPILASRQESQHKIPSN